MYGPLCHNLSTTSCPIGVFQPNVSHHGMPDQLKTMARITAPSHTIQDGDSKYKEELLTSKIPGGRSSLGQVETRGAEALLMAVLHVSLQAPVGHYAGRGRAASN